MCLYKKKDQQYLYMLNLMHRVNQWFVVRHFCHHTQVTQMNVNDKNGYHFSGNTSAFVYCLQLFQITKIFTRTVQHLLFNIEKSKKHAKT